MTSADARPEQNLQSAVDLVEQATEEVRAEASRVALAAMALRETMDARAEELGRTQQELESRRAAIEDEVQRARSDADAVLSSIRSEVAGEQARLAEVQRQHAETMSDVADLARAKDQMLAQLGRAQQQVDQVLPAMDDLLRARDTLHAVVSSFGDEDDPVAEHDRVAKPIGRIMDVSGEGDDR